MLDRKKYNEKKRKSREKHQKCKGNKNQEMESVILSEKCQSNKFRKRFVSVLFRGV